MQITKVLDGLLKAKKHNNHLMLRMLEHSVELIDKQGCGCCFKDYGTAYINNKYCTKDAIEILTSIPDKYLVKHYG